MNNQLTYSEKFQLIHAFDLISIVTTELQQIIKHRKNLSMFELFDEQEKFLEFMYKIATKKRFEKVLQTFNGRILKIAVVFVKAYNPRSIDQNLDLLKKFDIEGYNTIYLLAINWANSVIAKLIADIYTRKTEYKLDWERKLKHCPIVDKRTVIRISRISDLDKLNLSSSFLEKVLREKPGENVQYEVAS